MSDKIKRKAEKKVLTKQDLIHHLVKKLDYTHAQSFSHVDGFIEAFVDLLSAGNHLKITAFGDFIMQDKAARPDRNPKTGEACEITERRVVRFHPSVKLKSTVRMIAADLDGKEGDQ